MPRSSRSTCVLLLALLSHATAVTLDDVVSQWSVNSASYNFSVPSSTLTSGDAADYIRSNWQLSGKISWGENDM